VDVIPSRERRGRLAVEVARSYHLRRDYPATLHWLEQAYRTCTDSVHYSPVARQMASDVVDHAAPLISRGARTLACSLNLPLWERARCAPLHRWAHSAPVTRCHRSYRRS
jgi:hypothetical protein